GSLGAGGEVGAAAAGGRRPRCRRGAADRRGRRAGLLAVAAGRGQGGGRGNGEGCRPPRPAGRSRGEGKGAGAAQRGRQGPPSLRGGRAPGGGAAPPGRGAVLL